MEKILRLENVTKYYGTGSVVTKALDGISFEIEKGEFTAIMGASGSGKSTLLNVISTIDRPSSGRILVEGSDISKMSENQLSSFRRDKLGFIFQDYNLLDTLTVGENIMLPLNLKKVGADKAESEMKRIAGVLGIESQLQKFPVELSGGQQQRAACARALITSPLLVMADEPTGALDSVNSRGLMKTFGLMNSSFGSTILMVTHDAVVGSYASRILFLKDGMIWNELLKGDRSRQEMYSEILKVSAALGGEGDAC